MSLAPQEQFKKFLENSKEVLLFIPENPSGDAIGSAWALYFFLEKRGILPTIAFSHTVPQKYSFLPQPVNICSEISGARDFVLSFDTSRNKIINIRSEEKDNQYNIYLTPEKGSIDPKDFSFILANFKYDLLIVLDSPDLERLGKLYEANPDLFFEIPIINIDHKSTNENFGQINLVDVMASSTSEILSHIFESVDSSLIDDKISSCLLTGIISATDSFRKKNTTPRTLLAAAAIMDKGASQQEIIRWLYKTQPLNILKLWGRVMAKLKWDEELRLVWSELTIEDFVQSRSTPEHITSILEKLQENYSEGRIFMTLYGATPTSVMVHIKTSNPDVAKKIHAHLGGTIQRELLELSFESDNISETSRMILQKIKEIEL